MTLAKLLRFLTLWLLAVALMVSCRAKDDTTNTQAVDSPIESSELTQPVDSDSFPQQKGFVNDFENIYTNAEEAVLDSLLADVEKKTTVQIAVVTFDTTMTTKANFDAFTLDLANKWGVGSQQQNNGVVIGISKGYRKIRIQNGYGIETILTDDETKAIVDTAFIPALREGNYYQGTVNGLNALIEVLVKNKK